MRRRQRFCVFIVIDCLSVKEGAAVQVVERFASSRGIVQGRLLRLGGGSPSDGLREAQERG